MVKIKRYFKDVHEVIETMATSSRPVVFFNKESIIYCDKSKNLHALHMIDGSLSFLTGEEILKQVWEGIEMCCDYIKFENVTLYEEDLYFNVPKVDNWVA